MARLRKSESPCTNPAIVIPSPITLSAPKDITVRLGTKPAYASAYTLEDEAS